MALFLAPIANDQQEDANGAPLSGGTIEVYLAGTSTPATTYSDKAGLVPNTDPITLNTLGVNSQGAVWLTGGAAYKFVIKNSVGVVQRTIDNVSGINDNTVTADQWVTFLGAPTYVSATSFTVAGDQTQTFQVSRRVKTVNTGGTVYSTITGSVYGAPNTTVTVRNDSGVLDSGLSQVSYGIISPLDTSLPTGLLIGVRVFTAASSIYTPTAGTKAVIVTCVGGGGGGGGAAATGAAQASAGSGGAGGGYAKKRIPSGFSGVTMAVGAAGSAAAGSGGGTGGTTSFGGLVAATGGVGGVLGAVQSNANSFFYGATAAAGAGSSGDINISGGNGSFGFIAPSSLQVGGGGGASAIGAGAPPAIGFAGGATAVNYGGGGGGGSNVPSSGTAVGGGLGGPGVIIVEEYA